MEIFLVLILSDDTVKDTEYLENNTNKKFTNLFLKKNKMMNLFMKNRF